MSGKERALSLLLGLGLLVLAGVMIGAWWDGTAGILAILTVVAVLLVLLTVTVLAVAGLGLVLLALLGRDDW